VLPKDDAGLVAERSQRFREAGVPDALAERIGALPFLACALDIAALADHAGQPLDRAARIYYEVGTQFALDEMRAAARRLPAETPWHKLAAHPGERLRCRAGPSRCLVRSKRRRARSCRSARPRAAGRRNPRSCDARCRQPPAAPGARIDPDRNDSRWLDVHHLAQLLHDFGVGQR